jgi:hypothetical protein
MISLLVFYAHIIAFTALFTKRWQEEGVTEGILAAAFALLIFFAGWSMTSFILKLVMDVKGFGRWLDRDAASLLALTLIEAAFYGAFFRTSKRSTEPGEPGGN